MHISWNKILYVYAFLLFLMNFIRIFDNAFWGDEVFSIRLAQMTVGDMAATAADVHPPLYYLFVQLLYHVFGSSGVTYHLSALLPYAVIMMIGCTIVKKHFGVIPSVVLITMASLMKNAVRHNVEVRMYALAAMCVLIAYLAFYMVIQENKRINWIIFCIFSLGASYTHYYALLSVAFLYAMLIPMAIFRKKYRKGLFFSYFVAIAGYLPWLTILITTILKDSGVTYLDYNDSSFDRNRADYFYDDCHLSGAGAAEFTSLLCPDLMNADMEETE